MKSLIKVAVVAVGILFAGSAANAQQKLGHINSSDLLQAMPEMKTADASFKTYATAKQTTLEKMDGERQKKIAQYTEKTKTLSEANKESVSKEIQTLVTEIQDMEKRLQEAQQKSEEELQTKRTELYSLFLRRPKMLLR